MEKIIEDLLDLIGLEISYKGYQYWVEAISIKLKNSFIPMMEIYSIISKKYHTTVASIERAMRQRVVKSNTVIKKHFNVSYKITNVNFLALITREVKRKMEENRMVCDNETKYSVDYDKYEQDMNALAERDDKRWEDYKDD